MSLRVLNYAYCSNFDGFEVHLFTTWVLMIKINLGGFASLKMDLSRVSTSIFSGNLYRMDLKDYLLCVFEDIQQSLGNVTRLIRAVIIVYPIYGINMHFVDASATVRKLLDSVAFIHYV
jgi:hypothetical protein